MPPFNVSGGTGHGVAEAGIPGKVVDAAPRPALERDAARRPQWLVTSTNACPDPASVNALTSAARPDRTAQMR